MAVKEEYKEYARCAFCQERFSAPRLEEIPTIWCDGDWWAMPICYSCLQAYNDDGGDLDKLKFPQDRRGYKRRRWLEKYGIVEKEPQKKLDAWLK